GVSQAKTVGASVTFDQVTFAYPGGRQPAHTGLSFNVAEGERIGFVGSSGAGKSTIMKLLLRFFDADQGQIRVGGQDIRTLTTQALYQQLAVVSQDTYLFHGTVADNLRFGRMHATSEELQEAARQANAHEFIAQLPHGYDTVIGERGIRLSGGQRQRIAIARALLRDAPILVLDEALSAVDAENEAVIQQALDRLMQGRTTLIFAHRLSSVIGCDRIIVLDDGQVVESGTHEQLLVQHDYYWRLMASQLGSDTQALFHNDAEVDDRVNDDIKTDAAVHQQHEKATDEFLQAKGLGWRGVIRELSGYVSAYKGRLTMTFVFGVLRVLAFIGVGVLSALIVAAVKTEQTYDDLLLWLGVLAAISGLLHWLESWVAHDMAFRMLADLRAKLYEKLESLAPAFLVRRRSGDMVAMATHDVEMVEYFFAHTVAPAFVAILVPSLVLVVLGWHSWLLAFVLIPFLLIVGLSPFLLRRRIDDLGSRARESLAELNAYVVDSIQGLHEIIAFRQVSNRRDTFVAQIKNYLAIRQPFLRDLSWQTAVLEIVTGLGGLVIVMTGAYLVSTGEVSETLLPMLTLLALSAFLPVSEIAQVSRQLANTLGATRRLHAVQTAPVTVGDGSGVNLTIVDDQSSTLAVEMNAVSFTYEAAHTTTLNAISFSVPVGNTVAFVGPSGSGKTTIAHLLLRFWDPNSGSVQLYGHDLRDFSLNELREKIALVSQDTYLFNATLRENILMARPEADEQAINDAIRRAALEDFVANQPQGLDTPVGERGLRLSGGQRQRVAIARAFLKDAPILILDEATSHLDAVSEAIVRQSLEDLMHDRTTIVIAHRLSTVRNADKIVVLKAGCVVEMGNHDELLAQGGLYKQLVSRQLVM
ncbi:MAG: thiol reductant ABC exporter subunit CydC, partial [Nitrosomonas sp.]|nr:thiol reductant ABC exporter subunit CydC [Nitrosomonas sp.]